MPLVQPFGGHAIYVDARALLPHIPPLEYPGQALAVELYAAGGIRGCEIGTVMFGRSPDGSEQPAAMDLVRLAIPRRTYTQSHVDYVIEVARNVVERVPQLRGYTHHVAAVVAAPLHGAVRAARALICRELVRQVEAERPEDERVDGDERDRGRERHVEGLAEHRQPGGHCRPPSPRAATGTAPRTRAATTT